MWKKLWCNLFHRKWQDCAEYRWKSQGDTEGTCVCRWDCTRCGREWVVKFQTNSAELYRSDTQTSTKIAYESDGSYVDDLGVRVFPAPEVGF